MLFLSSISHDKLSENCGELTPIEMLLLDLILHIDSVCMYLHENNNIFFSANLCVNTAKAF